jgi:hypothetical protein
MTEPTPIRPDMPASRDVREPRFLEAIRQGRRELFTSQTGDGDAIRSVAALLLLASIVWAIFLLDFVDNPPGAAFTLAAIGLLLYRVIQDAILRSFGAPTILVPFIAVCAATIAFSGLLPVLSALQLPDGTLPGVQSVGSIVLLVVCYMLVSGLLGEGFSRSSDPYVATTLQSRSSVSSPSTQTPETPLEDLEPGWGPDADDCPYRYFVNYRFSHSSGYSDRVVCMARTFPITCEYDVRHMAEHLRQLLLTSLPHLSGHRVVITSWQRFEAPEPDATPRRPHSPSNTSKNVIAFRR